MTNQTLIDGGKFEVYHKPDGTAYRVCWLRNGLQYVVEPINGGKSYVASLKNGYTGKTLERIWSFKHQHSCMYQCQEHFNAGKAAKWTRITNEEWVQQA